MNGIARKLSPHTPRHIDLFTRAVILFGGVIQQFGWAFFAFGSIFAWIFLPMSEARYWLQSTRNWAETEGLIETREATNASVNRQTVYRYAHSFEYQGQRYLGSSFSAGERYAPGDVVRVRFNPARPERASYVTGAGRAPFSGWVVFVLIFPLVGLAIAGASLPASLKSLRLLVHGIPARGQLVEKADTHSSITINNAHYPIYRYTFAFEVAGRTYQATCRTHEGARVEDESQEIILYDPMNPAFNAVLDATPNLPAITPLGEIAPAAPAKALTLLLPALALFIQVAGAWLVIRQ